MKESIRIMEMLNLDEDATYETITKQFNVAREELDKKKKRAKDIHGEIKLQNEILDLEDAYLEYQHHKNEEVRKTLRKKSD